MDAHFATLVGEATNLSERGIYFTSSEKIRTGQPLEMYFIIPRELTGRRAEDVRCSARIVHMDSGPDREGRAGVGAVIGHFDALPAPHNWNN